jgi:hypothetical protein
VDQEEDRDEHRRDEDPWESRHCLRAWPFHHTDPQRTLCNLACENCYIESSPENDRLVYLTPGRRCGGFSMTPRAEIRVPPRSASPAASHS